MDDLEYWVQHGSHKGKEFCHPQGVALHATGNASQAMPQQPTTTLEQIKRLVIISIISDDDLFENLVLKGGNAIDLIHQITARASVDIDFSMSQDFPGGSEELKTRVERALTKTFRQNDYEVFDLKMADKPEHLTEDMAKFWGGYGFEFKLISSRLFEQYSTDIDALRKYALNIGQGRKFLIDISRFEYTQDKLRLDFDGYVIYVYSTEMIVCEKLRAVCQQMSEYGPIVKRERRGSARARDFIDIYFLTATCHLNISSEKNCEILSEMFELKKVPLQFLGKIQGYREFHRPDFAAVQATVRPTIELKSFDFYFDFTLGLVEELKPLWNV